MTSDAGVYKISILVPAGDKTPIDRVASQWSTQKTADYGRMADNSVTAQTALLLNEVLQKTIDVCQAMEIPQTADWVVEGYSATPPDMATVEMVAKLVFEMRALPAPPKITIEQLPNIDWVTENQKSFKPVHAGRFFVHTSDYDGVIPRHKIPLVLNAGAAFGTGGHGTTAGCLLALSDLAKSRHFKTILDVGTGTGILALGACGLWNTASILATDIDPTAIAVTRYNMGMNRCRWQIQTAVATGMTGRVIAGGAPYDLIIANILAGPLRAMSVPVVDAMARGGVVVLSGIWDTQKTSVINAYRRCGLVLSKQYAMDNWHTLVMVKK